MICVIVCSYLEADRIINTSIHQFFINNSGNKLFNLNSVLNLSKFDNDCYNSLNKKNSIYKKSNFIININNNKKNEMNYF